MASKQLAYGMQPQSQSNWCWAAVGASTGNYYWPGANYQQCKVADTCQGKTTCCSAPGGCNQYGYLDQALTATRSFDRMTGSSEPYPQVVGTIDADRPLGTRVAWNGGGAHFMMLTGYDDGAQTVTVDDSIYGRSVIRFSAYPASYKSGGAWTHSYYTRKN